MGSPRRRPIGPHGGLNFDAKPRRTSFTAEDLFRSHIAGMDSFAAGLLVAAKMHEDKVIENLQAERYSSFDSGIGATVENGTASWLPSRSTLWISRSPSSSRPPSPITSSPSRPRSTTIRSTPWPRREPKTH